MMQFQFKFELSILIFFLVSYISSQTLNIHIQNLKNSSGQLLIAVFESQAEFDVEKPRSSIKYTKTTSNEIWIKLEVSPDIYGISVLDDENENSKMDVNFIGIPLEGIGFSGINKLIFRKLKFKDFQFEVRDYESKDVIIKMKYFLK